MEMVFNILNILNYAPVMLVMIDEVGIFLQYIMTEFLKQHPFGLIKLRCEEGQAGNLYRMGHVKALIWDCLPIKFIIPGVILQHRLFLW